MVRSALHTVWAVVGMGWILCAMACTAQDAEVSGALATASERMPAPATESLPEDRLLEQLVEATDTIGKLRVALYDIVKSRQHAERERAGAEEEVRHLEARLGPLKVEADNTAAALSEETARREDAEARMMEQQKEIVSLHETTDALQREISRLERIYQEMTIAPAEVVPAAHVEIVAKPMPSARPPAPGIDIALEEDGVAAADDLMMEANRLLRQGDAHGAADYFIRVLRSRPDDPGASIGLAASRYAAGQTAEALDLVDVILKEDRNNPQALGVKALIVWRQGDLRQADRLLAKAIRMEPDDVRLRNYRGIVGYERKAYDKALKDLEWAVDLDPSDPESRFNLAVLLAGKPDPDLDTARAHYQAALKYGGIRDEELERALSR